MYKALKYTPLPAECAQARLDEAFSYKIFLLDWDKASLGFYDGTPAAGTRIRFADWLELEDRGYTS